MCLMSVRVMTIASVCLFASIASAQTVTIDFESLPDGTPLVQSDTISTEYLSLGVEFYTVGSALDPQIATNDDAPGGGGIVAFANNCYVSDKANFATPTSGVNLLTDPFDYVPSADYGALFVTPVSKVSLKLIDFGDCVTAPVGTPATAELVAYDAGGNVVDVGSVTVLTSRGGCPDDGTVLDLSVTGSGIIRVETQGVTQDCATAIDDFTFTIEETCDPHAQGFWKRQCKGPHPSGEHELLPDYVFCVNLTATFASVASEDDICDVMWFGPPKNDKCEQAEAQFMAMLLNICSGRLDRSCCIDSELTAAATVGEAEIEVDALLSNPDRTFDDCVLAQAIADEINTGAVLCNPTGLRTAGAMQSSRGGWCALAVGPPMSLADIFGTMLPLLGLALWLGASQFLRQRRPVAAP